MYIDTNGFEIGDKVRDTVTLFEGIIVGITQWTTGCARASVQPQMSPKAVKDGEKIRDAYSIDCLTLMMLEPGPRHEAKALDPELVGATKGGPPTLVERDDHYHG